MKSSTPPPQKIQHLVVLQENRTPDNLFPDAKLIAAGADIRKLRREFEGHADYADARPAGKRLQSRPLPLFLDVSWVLPSGAASDHAGINEGSDPPGWPRW